MNGPVRLRSWKEERKGMLLTDKLGDGDVIVSLSVGDVLAHEKNSTDLQLHTTERREKDIYTLSSACATEEEDSYSGTANRQSGSKEGRSGWP